MSSNKTVSPIFHPNDGFITQMFYRSRWIYIFLNDKKICGTITKDDNEIKQYFHFEDMPSYYLNFIYILDEGIKKLDKIEIHKLTPNYLKLNFTAELIDSINPEDLPKYSELDAKAGTKERILKVFNDFLRTL